MKVLKITRVSTAATTAALMLLAGACGGSGSSNSTASARTTTTGSTAPSALTITAGDYAFDGVPATFTAGIQKITFVNQGSVAHEMVFVKVTPGTTTKSAFAAYRVLLKGGPYPASFLAANGVHQTEPGATSVTEFNLTAGDYLALCTDSGAAGSTKDGPPHFARGMYKKLTVTGTAGDTPPTATASITAYDYGFALSGLTAGSQTIAFKNTSKVQYHFADLNVFPKGVTIQQAEQSLRTPTSNGAPAPRITPLEVASSQLAGPGWGSTFTATLAKGLTYIIFCWVSDVQGGSPHTIGHKMYKVFAVS
jgi:plastocyanin